MNYLPTGTITFLFTDIEGSTKLWERYPEAMRSALARHDALLRSTLHAHGGMVFKTVGDAFCAAFPTAPEAVVAAVQIQRSLQQETWPEPIASIRVRMALHTGTVEARDGDYFGPVLNRIARLLATGHGGQTLVSASTFELARDLLPEEVHLRDLGPHRLKDLERPEQVYQVTHPDLPAPDSFPPLTSLDNPTLPNNLPQQITSFIGREKEIAQVRALLEKTRLLTLTGSGGSGKTRLALQSAADVLEAFPDGVWMVEIAPLADAARVPQTVASVLGVKEQTGQSILQTLAEYLQSKRLLILLDNCEHLVAACAQLVAALLRSSSEVRILATSREALGIAGEQIFRVPSLSLPDPTRATITTAADLTQYEGVRLFIERAELVKPDFAVTNQNAPALAQLCQRLDGIPLAIELAAARIRSLSVEDINNKLDSRFRLLTGGDRFALPRQQTLRSAIDWSYDLLGEQERLLLSRLSVFSGGWTLEAAESVCGFAPIEDTEVLDLLISLVDKSLVLAELIEEESGAGGGTQSFSRYRLLETLRQYAAEKRDASVGRGSPDAAKDRHVDWFLALAEEAEPQLIGPDQAAWLHRLETEHDNLRAALAWCAADAAGDDSGEQGLRLAAALARFWQARGYLTEGEEYLRGALGRALPQTANALRAKAGNGAGNLAYQRGDYPAARTLYSDSLALFRSLTDRQGIAIALGNLGNIAKEQGEYTTARALLDDSLALSREMEDRPGIAHSLNSLSNIALKQGDYATAQALQEESLALFRTVGDKRNIAIALSNLGNVAFSQVDYVEAQSQYAESLWVFRELEDRLGIAITLGNLGGVAQDQGDSETARTLYEESLLLSRELGDRSGVAYALGNLGSVARTQGDYEVARTRYNESLALRRELGDRHGMAYTLDNLGSIALLQGDAATARSLYTQSFILFCEVEDKRGIAIAMADIAELSLRESRALPAVVLWGATHALRESIGSPLTPEERARQEQRLAQARSVLGDGAFSAAWKQGCALTWEQAVANTREAL